jgi:hypothetical protein
MAGSIKEPMAVTSATPEPEMAPKNMQEMTMTMARPPAMQPTRVLANPMIRSVILASDMSWPASRKSGMASRGKESIPMVICWEMTASETLPYSSR